MTDFTCPNCGQSCYPDDPCPCRDLDDEARERIGRVIRWKDIFLDKSEFEIARLTARIADLEAANACLLDRLTSAEARADHRMALRVELEQLLGVPPGPATDDQFEAGVAAVRALKAALVRADDRVAELLVALDEAAALSVLDDPEMPR